MHSYPIGDYRMDILVVGYPGKSVCHGALGWSSIVLLRGMGRVALIDVGTFNIRTHLIQALAARGLSPADVTDVVLTHCHWDHSVNWPLFRDATIHLGGAELDWGLAQPWGETPVPEFYVEKLAGWPTLNRVTAGDAVLPGLTAHDAPGHTPGHLIFVLSTAARDVILTGDAAKNRTELVSRETDMTYDPAVSRASIDHIWSLWERRPETIVVPGHDLPMVLRDGHPTYLGEREAAIRAWMSDTLDQTTEFTLTA